MPEAKVFDACSVCGRTILRGERVAEYATADGAEAGVCALCKPAAEQAGWVPAALAGAAAAPSTRRRRSLGLRQRIAKVSGAARGVAARPEPDAEAGAAEEPRPGRKGDRPAAPAARQRSRAASRQGHAPGASAPAERKPASGRPERRANPERLVRKGAEIFNASEGPRKVAGLIRSLGDPQVTVRPKSGGAIVVTVAWELSWYQWEIAAAEGRISVREIGKGSEVDQLGERDRAWNASATAEGTVRIERIAAPRATAKPG